MILKTVRYIYPVSQGLLIFSYSCLFLWLLRVLPFTRNSGIDQHWLSGAFILKVFAGTALWAIYTYHYTDRSTADIFKYFDDGAIMYSSLLSEPLHYFKMISGVENDSEVFNQLYYSEMNHWFREWETSFYNDTHTIIRWNAVVMVFSFGHFHVHTLFMSFCSLLGCVGLYRAFASILPDKPKALFLSCIFLPSMLLWSSAPTKEGLLICGLGLFIYGFYQFSKYEQTFKWLLLMALGATLVFFQKFYVLASMLPALLVVFWHWKKPTLHWGLKSALVLILALCCVSVLEYLGPGYELMGRMAKKQEDFLNHALETGSTSMIPLMQLNGTLWGFLKSLPHAFLITLLGPSVYWKGGLLGVFSNLENVFILTCLLLAIVFRRNAFRAQQGTIILCIGFTLVLFVLIGWTTPVLGALVRYRLPALPFIMVLSLILVDSDRVTKRFPFLRKLIQ